MYNLEKSLKRLVSFCHDFENIVCYGAAEYAHNVKLFLNINNIKVDYFLVSEKVGKNETKDGIPVHSICDAPHSLNKCGIILSLDKVHYEEVKDKLFCRDVEKRAVCEIDSQLEKEIYKWVTCYKRDELLFSMETDSKELADKYDLRIKNIFKQYEKIEIKFIYAGSLGGIGEWIAYWNMRRNKRVFYALFPMNWNGNQSEIQMSVANEYLLNKLQNPWMELIFINNINFWRYFIFFHKEKFLFNNQVGFAAQNLNINEILDNLNEKQQYISFNQKEIILGEKELKKLGVNQEFICIANRDDLYYKLKKINLRKFIDIYRNSRFETRGLAIRYLMKKNILSVRMGAAVKDDFSCEGLINYGKNERTEFMDIFLAAKCKFFVSDLSGITMLGMLFSKPTVITNAALLTTRGDVVPLLKDNRDLAILKKMWDVKKKRYLTIKEMLEVEINKKYSDKIIYNTFRQYEEKNIVPIENTEEEILAVVNEMEMRLSGEFVYSDLDRKLQKKYRNIIEGYSLEENILNRWRLGALFLKENQWLLN